MGWATWSDQGILIDTDDEADYGRHTITCWDTLNDPNESSIEYTFVIKIIPNLQPPAESQETLYDVGRGLVDYILDPFTGIGSYSIVYSV